MKLKVVTGLILISLLTGCEPVDSVMSDYKGDTMYFKTLSSEEYGKIIYDARTGVEYWMSEGSGNYGTLTLLVDENGKPLIYDSSED